MADQLSPLDGPGPDLMNDPQYATNTTDGEDGMGDADTCRICRTEGGDSESLFHPCKCSGSIKYVHQDCLMEWLSHSQKKHCELCKTSFRFTKLYSPNMPQNLPFHLLVRHVFIHILKNLGTWLRFGLVVFVWLGCLPFVIRQVWRLLFWFSDGGWPMSPLASSVDSVGVAKNQTDELLFQLLREQANANATSPVTPLSAAPTTPAHVADVVDKIIGIVAPFAQLLNVSDSDPLVEGFFKAILSAFGAQDILFPPLVQNQNVNSQTYEPTLVTPPSTLLSEVQFLKNFTRYAHVNQLVISIVEGYVITILVVICFILIFLIREWVVQQQPGINMGAGFNADFAPVDRGRDQPIVPINNPQDRGDHAQRPGARPRRRNLAMDPDMPLAADEDPLADNPLQNRPSPIRDALSPAAEIQRRLTEEPRFTEEFLSIWRRAEGSPDEVLRIIEAEDKSEQMRYWVNSMKVLQRPSPGERSQDSQSSWTSEEFDEGSTRRLSESHVSVTSTTLQSLRAQPAENDVGSIDSDNWINFGETAPRSEASCRDFQDSVSSSNKGKEKASDENHNPSLPAIFSSSSGTRPRATSDGPQPSQTISPLASGTWTFNNLPDAAEELESKPPWDRERQSRSEKTSSINFSSSTASVLPATTALSHSADQGTWKLEQDLLVQRAIEKGRELRRGSLKQTQSTYPLFIDASGDEEDRPIEIIGQDGVVRTVQNWDEELASHPVPRSDDGVEVNRPAGDQSELGPFEVPEPRPAIVIAPPQPRGVVDSLADFFWGGVGDGAPETEQGGNDEHVVHDLAAEPPFVPVANREPLEEDDDDDPQDPEVAEAALPEGFDPNDPDAMDDAEDFEGIMELVGMRGPIFSLFQNAIFSAFLLSLTVAIGIWIPYNIGRISLLLTANPGTAFKLPLKFIFGCAAFIQDLGLSLLGISTYTIMLVLSLPLQISGYASNANVILGAAKIKSAALNLSGDSLQRVSNGTFETLIHLTDSDIFAFSAASHESLINLKALTMDVISKIGKVSSTVFTGNRNLTTATSLHISRALAQNASDILRAVPSVLAKPETWVISLEIPKRSEPLDLALSVWSGTDRFWAVVAGYTTICIAGALYVKKGTPFSSGPVGREWEATIIDLLNQAGGVFKVILIISIEMLVFPLYCGLLLDAALLPLFDKASIISRLLFTLKSPLTSIFVHWFVGTCYMFHFALFVSMCRKIMRKGVLYFIRDPDDPTFHPVRDVLERNVATQLRKILFSALVYGALVVVCLGGVVWGLAFAFRGVLPIHWSSNEPVLEFPVDLLFYNFLMPLAVRFFKPSDALHSMYTWWFRKCARMLRLTWFMFDERRKDEEGHHVRRTWNDILRFTEGDPENFKTDQDINAPFTENPEMAAYFHRDGRYVRAPASDQVRIPKGQKIFLEVDEHNKRIDGEPDRRDGVHGSDNSLYKHLYIPPWFRLRIFSFIISIWFFAAFTGVSITVIPLVFGRYVFAKLIPPHVRKNDVYAFSIGIYILGSALYGALHLNTFYNYLKQAIAATIEAPNHFLRRAAVLVAFVARISWTYTAFLFILPALFAAFVEFYFIIPLHTYFALEERHIVHFVQSWTLGLLYLKLTTRLILWHENSRQAQSLQAITRNGYLNPDARLATRSFILPVGIALSFALSVPWGLARLATTTFLKDKPETHVLAYRYTYPLFLWVGIVCFAFYLLWGMLRRWQMLIKDEVYLIGERLHNFGERKSTAVGVGPPPSMRRIET